MKTKLLFLLTIIISLLSCEENNKINITGQLNGIDSVDTIFIKQRINRQYIDLYTIPISNNTFSFNTQVDSSQVAYIIFSQNSNQRMFNIPICIEPGKVVIDINEDGSSIISGTKGNDALNDFNTQQREFSENKNKLYSQSQSQEFTLQQKDSLQQLIQTIESQIHTLAPDMMKKHINTLGGLHLLLRNNYNVQPQEVLSIISLLSTEYAQNVDVIRLKESSEVKMKTAVGGKFVDFEMNDPYGNKIKLSDIISKNKYTLLDFWASWCGPCIVELPSVVEAYNLYKDSGFGVIGVSLDNDSAAWKNAIQKHGCTWDHISDLKGWNSEGAKLYGVSSIPTTLLIDQEGTIVARNLRGKAIADKLSELLK